MAPPDFQLAKRLDGVSESATLKLNAAVQALKAKGENVINFTAGEPDFWVPDEAKNAAIEAVRANQSRYTAVAGIPELREQIAKKTSAQQPGVAPWKGSNVVVTNGGKQALFNVCLATLNPGDEVIIPSPYWLSYPEMVKLAGGVPKPLHAPLSQNFKIKPEQLERAIGPKTRMIIFNSPSNPTGAMYSRSEFEALAQVLGSTPEARKILILSDEIYDRIILGKTPFCSFLGAAPGLRDRTITVNGMSKSAAMTGWRIGWSVTPEWLTPGIVTIQGQSTSGINAPAQWASLAALRLPESIFGHQVESFQRRRDLVLEKLGKAPKIELFTPEGAFYAFVGVGKYFRAGEDSMSFAERLLEGAKVAVVPGTPFGEPGFLRLSFATDERTIEEGCDRIVKFLHSL